MRKQAPARGTVSRARARDGAKPLPSLLATLCLLAASSALAVEVPLSSQPSISSGLSAPVDARLADLDADGDLDVIFASRDANLVGWLEKTGAGYTQRTIESLTSPTSAFVADLDGDGDLDVAVTSDSQDRVRWYASDGDSPPAFTAYDVSTTADGAEEVFAADMNRDGRLDLVSVAKNDDEIAWYENDGDSPAGFARAVIDEDPDAAGSGAEGYLNAPSGVLVFDPDRDGDPDVAAIGNSALAWFENANGLGTSWTPHTAASGLATGTQIATADFDRDGDPDLVAAVRNDDSVYWYENDGTPGTGSWTQRTVSSTVDFGTGGNVSVGDVDRDGDVDVLAGSGVDQKLFWFMNDGAAVPAFTAFDVASQLPIKHPAVGDLDGDGDADLVSLNATGGQLRWIRNDAIHRSAAFFTPPDTIDAAPDLPNWVSAADLDRDGDQDALIINVGVTGGIRWRENSDGAGDFGPANLIATANHARVIRVADMDRDGDPDLVTAATGGTPGLAWHENTSPQTALSWTTRTISSSYPSPYGADVGDIDGDGDPDVFASNIPSAAVPTVAWFENTAGDGTTWSEHLVATTPGYATDVRLADVDRDGDLDAFYNDINFATIAWKENTAGDGSTWTDHVVEAGLTTVVPNTVEPVDFDRDGDIDVVVASRGSNNSAWFENANGAGTSWTRHSLDSPARIFMLRASDLDLDGDLDVVGAGEQADDVFVFENTAGDGSTWTVTPLGANVEGPLAVDAADLDGDGDPDLLATGFQVGSPDVDGPIIWLENGGGQFGLRTASTAYQGMLDNRARDVLAISSSHRGRTGDSAADLASIELRLQNGTGGALDAAEAGALFDEIRIYADDGSGRFEIGSDTSVGLALAPFSPVDGVISVVTGTANLSAESTQLLFVVPKLDAAASSAGTTQFQIVHRTQSGVVSDVVSGLPLSVESYSEPTTGVVQALPSAGDADADGLSNADEADVHFSDPLDTDTDGDDLDDGDEVTTYNTSPIDTDDDDDGLLDGAEVALGTDPTDEDTDGDLVCDGGNQVGDCTAVGPDNCPFISNAAQTNGDALPAGNACQCGDVNEDGIVSAADVDKARAHVVGATVAPPFEPARCNLVGPRDAGVTDCEVRDLFILRRVVAALPASIENACSAYFAP